MKALTLIISLGTLSLSNQSQAYYSVASETQKVDVSQVKLYVGALQGASRDWLKTCQNLEKGELSNQLAGDIRSCIRLARSFQVTAMDFQWLSENQEALKIAVDNAATNYNQISANYRLIRRKMLSLSRSQGLDPLLTRKAINELDENYKRVRTLYVALSNLLATGEVY